MEFTTNQKGNLTELQVITAIYELGYDVSIPYGNNARYDLIMDINGKLFRVQVKTCQVDTTGISFSCRSTHKGVHNTTYQYYTAEEVDYFATFYDGKCYLVPIAECIKTNCKKLTFSDRRVNQHTPSFIENYELSKRIQNILEGKTEALPSEYIIYQYDLEGNLVATYPSCGAAARALGDVSKNSHINQAVNGERKTAYGFKWSKEPLNK